jgi:hypothetical protein
MNRWNGQELTNDSAPSLGFTLSTAILIPAFVEQMLSLNLFAHADDTQITPLDDLKEWMRADPWRTGQLFEDVNGLLLGEELKARKAAEKAGVPFDPVGFELEQMEADETFESFNPLWAGRIFGLAIEDAEEIQAWSRREHGLDFALAASFQLGDLRKHPRFSFEQEAAALAAYGAATPLVESVRKGRPVRAELSGSIQLDFSDPGKAPPYERRNGVGFVRIPLADPRAGDGVHAHLALAYSLEAEGLFLLHFDALRQDLALKNAVAE